MSAAFVDFCCLSFFGFWWTRYSHGGLGEAGGALLPSKLLDSGVDWVDGVYCPAMFEGIDTYGALCNHSDNLHHR